MFDLLSTRRGTSWRAVVCRGPTAAAQGMCPKWLVCGFACALACGGCSSSPASGAPADGGADVRAGDAGGPPACEATSACVQAPVAGQRCVTTVDATMVDPTNARAPVASLPVYVCGTNLCTQPSTTGTDGRVTVAACLPFASPALKVFSDPKWAAFAALLTGAGPGYSLGAVPVVPLPAAGVAFPASGQAILTSGAVSLSISPGTTVTFDVTHQDPSSRQFRAVEVPAAQLPGSLAGGVSDAFALAPLNTKLAPPGLLTVPNTQGWAAGAQVDFYLDGTDAASASPPAPWGTWGLVGTGQVNADGKEITLSGLPELAMVGVKLH
jgi:hypothetical protein